MGRNLSQLIRHQAREASSERWMTGVEGIVVENEDPENQHRIKVKIEVLDEFKVLDKWVRQIGCYVGGPGYGSFFVPEINTEVILFGRLGQKYNLYYMSVYNEDFPVPADFRFPREGGNSRTRRSEVHHRKAGDMQLRGGGLRMQADFGAIEIIAPWRADDQREAGLMRSKEEALELFRHKGSRSGPRPGPHPETCGRRDCF